MFKFLDGSQDREVLSFCTGEKVNAMGETSGMERRRIEIEQRAKEQVNSEVSKRLKAEKEKSGLDGEISDLENQVASLERENRELKAEKVKSRLENIAAKVSLDLDKVKIKVLSGSGSLASALEMTKHLESNGYKVERTDMAPSTDFSRDKVFFRKGNNSTAKEIAKNIGSTAVAAPMTWKSKFDIIVVTRNKDFAK
ncbi:MAG: LytR C-terminal domain-containing protein [Thermodesulfovibrionales bacterium]|nr:LytR C-terminal domain-containing protein [Thermodesulfovibrionales bacterium]